MHTIENITLYELQQCIVTAARGDPTASQYLDVLRSNHPRVCVSKCLELMYNFIESRVSLDTNVVFYIMSSFQVCLRKSGNAMSESDHDYIPASIRLNVREVIFAFTTMVCEKILGNARNEGGFDASDSAIPSFVRTKISVVLVQCLHLDYPQYWPSAFDEILRLIQHQNAVDDPTNASFSERNILLEDIFVRICEAISEEIIVFRVDRSKVEVNRNNNIKERMKSNHSHIINELIRGLIGTFKNARNKKNEYLSNLVLSVMKRYLGWIEWEIIIKEEHNILPLLFECIKVGGQLAVESCDCLVEILDRSENDQMWNIKLCSEMCLFSALDNIDFDDNIDLTIKVAETITSIGVSLLDNLEKLPKDAEMENILRSNSNPPRPNESSVLIVSQLQHMMEMFWKCFAYDDIDVTSAVIPLAIRLTKCLENELLLSRQESKTSSKYFAFSVIDYFPRLLSLIYQQMIYPENFQFDYNDENDAEEQFFRAKLHKLLQKIVSVLPTEVLQFLCNTLSTLSMPLSTTRAVDVEAALQLVFHYCDGLSAEMTSKALKEGPFHQVIIALHQSDIALHHHREVVILYYEIVARYSQVLKYQPNLLTNILSNLSGANGIQHTHGRVRSRSCYLLLRLVKTMGPILRPYVETAVVGIQGLLSNQSKLPLQTDDFLNLFETTGLLLGTTDLNESTQKEFLVAILTPNIQSMDDIVSSGNLVRDPDHYGEILSDLIASVAHISKGFSKPCQDVKAVMITVVPSILKSLQALPTNAKVRSKTMITLHRLIVCIGADVLPLMNHFLSALVENCSSEDISDVSQLLNQLCTKFKSLSVNALNTAVLPFLKKCHELMPNETEVGTIAPHLQTEQMSIRKLSFVFLQYIVTKKVTSVLLSPENLPQLEYILNEMKFGAVSMIDPAINKTCIIFFRGLIDQWVDNKNNNIDDHIQNGVIRFVVDVVVRELLGNILNLKFDEKDALQSRVILEIGKLFHVLKSKRKPDLDHILSLHLNQFGCTNSFNQSFQCANSDADFYTFLREVIQSLRDTR